MHGATIKILRSLVCTYQSAQMFCFIPTLHVVFFLDRDVSWTFVCGCNSISEAQVKCAETVALLTDRFTNCAIHSS